MPPLPANPSWVISSHDSQPLFHCRLLLSFCGIRLWAQDGSTGALRGVVLDAQGAVITNADIVAIRVETEKYITTRPRIRWGGTVDLLPQDSIRRGQRRKACRRRFRR